MFKPMLAGRLDPPFILAPGRFPLMLSAKLDGIRASVQNGIVMSRALKPIPNKFVQATLGRPELNGLDGELILGSPIAENVFRRTTSAVMTQGGMPQLTYHVFDCYQDGWPFHMRLELAQDLVTAHASNLPIEVKVVPHHMVETNDRMAELEAEWVEQGYEGAMIRSVMGPYKQGRSTATEGWLLKLKRFVDAEAVVVGVEELLHNANPAKTNELGYLSHSSHKENLVPAGMLGALVVKDVETCVQFNIGTGFTEAQRKTLWLLKEALPGRVVVYKSQIVGVKDKPRIPVFKGWRHPLDMDEV